ncbi:flagellar M-ring protein FliF [Brevibacillus sp. SYP-B805]|uniref:flagellar basal-body MS-ring/collar protein FliF n=1 Tax=Brevibacillus sp. SYP-B805 TaxID=1578199 RepID=UPI0013EADA7F|nr:flagellar basal-body MS-ring/collar protein FliF [Brevibacillus sp. SYP-B805]NGQ94005.1 flagellar M-ring protein FliF [Brevibacillus sp. SYP-B805]
MNERLLRYRELVKEKWNSLNSKQKWLISSLSLFLLLSLGLYIYFASQPVYKSLYNQRLSEQEVGLIRQQLESQGIPYRITGNGTGIEVPETMAQDVIVDLAAQGIPSEAGINTEIFSGTGSFGITDRQFDVLEKDALQQELKNMLEHVRGVRSAQVMLTLPEESVWVTETPDQATASVIVEVEPGTRLGPEQIRSLYYMVSRSVKKLPLENITITDQYSNLLELPDKDASKGSLTQYQQQEEIKKNVEKEIQQNLYNLLGTLMGRDKVVVHTTVQMDFSQETRVENRVEAPDRENNEGLIISAQKLSKTFTGQGTPPGGAAGTGQNDVPSFPGSNPQGTNSQYEEINDTVNREVDRITRNITLSPYKIVDIGINIGVEPPDGGQLDEQTIANIRQILGTVVRVTLSDKNLTQDQIDQRITVFPRTFSGKIVQEQSLLSPALLYGTGAVALLALGAVGYLIFRRRRQVQQQQEESIPDLPPPQPFEVPDLQYKEDTDEVVVRKQLEKLARSKPDEFVVLLRTWLAED